MPIGPPSMGVSGPIGLQHPILGFPRAGGTDTQSHTTSGGGRLQQPLPSRHPRDQSSRDQTSNRPRHQPSSHQTSNHLREHSSNPSRENAPNQTREHSNHPSSLVQSSTCSTIVYSSSIGQISSSTSASANLHDGNLHHVDQSANGNEPAVQHRNGDIVSSSFMRNRPAPSPPSMNQRTSQCIHRRPLMGNTITDTKCLESCTGKYVLMCGASGFCSILLGSLYLVIYILLRHYTSSLQYFETMPTYVPATMQILTGVLVVCLVRRKHRISLLVKLCGFLCLVCAVLCVVVTVTTTVVHMNRLQTLHECEFIPHAQSCTCTTYTGIYEPGQEAIRFIFSDVTTCDVIHGPLYACLRAIFGLSVIGILVSIFSCMLVYQLLSHEKKKMYWEQLESRRRLLYPRPFSMSPSSVLSPGAGEGPEGVMAVGPAGECGCCTTDDYGFNSGQDGLYPYTIWDPVEQRCWSSGGLLANEGDRQANRRSLIMHYPPNRYTRSSSMEDPASHSGVLLRPPYLPRDVNSRVDYRRHPPSSQHRPLSDPGVALHLPPYPPPSFPEAFLTSMGYPPEAFPPGYLWGPPPPYSQPTSTENIPTATSRGDNVQPPDQGFVNESGTRNNGNNATSPQIVMASPVHHQRPATLADLMRGNGTQVSNNNNSSVCPTTNEQNQTNINNFINSPLHHIISRSGQKPLEIKVNEDYDGSNSLPSRYKNRKIPLSHVKSLGDVTCENTDNETKEKYLRHVHKTRPIDSLKNEKVELARHLKSISDPKSLYGKKMEPESEIYFADVSSCISLRPDNEEVMYYSDPTSSSSQHYKQIYQDPSSQSYLTNLSHMYEQVNVADDDEEIDVLGSHHSSDDTMIVHTSSSDQSVAEDHENTYQSMIGDSDNTYSMIESVDVENNDSLPVNEVVVDHVLDVPAVHGNINDIHSNKSENLHHPLHPVKHHQHQALHHHLGRKPEKEIFNEIEDAALKSKSTRRESSRKGTKKSKKCSSSRVIDEPKYESVDPAPEPILVENQNITTEAYMLDSSVKSPTSRSSSRKMTSNIVSSNLSPLKSPRKVKHNHLPPTPNRHPHNIQQQSSSPNKLPSSSSDIINGNMDPTKPLPKIPTEGNIPIKDSKAEKLTNKKDCRHKVSPSKKHRLDNISNEMSSKNAGYNQRIRSSDKKSESSKYENTKTHCRLGDKSPTKSKRRSSKDTPESGSKSAIVDSKACEGSKKSRRSKQADSEIKLKPYDLDLEGPIIADNKRSSSYSPNKSKSTTENVEYNTDKTKTSSNVHKLLQNLKSVNV